MRALVSVLLLTANCAPAATASENVANEAARPAPVRAEAVAKGQNSAAPANSVQAAPRSESLPERSADFLMRILDASPITDWEAAKAVFPGARWGRVEQPPMGPYAPADSSTHEQRGTLGREMEATVYGRGRAVDSVEFGYAGAEDWEPFARALSARGVNARSIGCLTGWGSGYYRLTKGDKSIVVDFVGFSGSAGSGEGSLVMFRVSAAKPFGDRTEQEVTNDRSGICVE